ncbi:hypothetical protein L1887_16195 [Cichorium endivia]|nr:hypothetical protein L1887_16195 [Cichorium endivia]
MDGAKELYEESKKRKSLGNTESVCEASIEWTVPHLIFCALCGILGGSVGGLLGSGGGFILGPLLLEIGIIPQAIVNKSRAGWLAMVSKIPVQIDEFEKIPAISEEIKNMMKSNSNVFFGKRAIVLLSVSN